MVRKTRVTVAKGSTDANLSIRRLAHIADAAGAQVEIHLQDFRDAPIQMRLPCEGCGELHIDEGEFATKPHHTHACQHCGLVWRPARENTVGVRFLPGYKNQ